MNKQVDFRVANEGNIFLLRPVSKAGKEWVTEHLPDDVMMWGEAAVVEHRFIGDIVEGIQGDGLVVQ